MTELTDGKKSKLLRSPSASACYYLSIKLRNIKCFGTLQTLDLSDTETKLPKQWTIIIGDNGSGKSTLLRCITGIQPAPRRMGQNQETGEVRYFPLYFSVLDNKRSIWEDLNRSGVAENIYLYADICKGTGFERKGYRGRTDSYDFQAYFPNSKNPVRSAIEVNKSFRNLVTFSYGANRKVGAASLSEALETWQPSLFTDDPVLINPVEWLLQADYAAAKGSESAKKRLNAIKKILVMLLPDVKSIRIKSPDDNVKTSDVEFKTSYGWVTFANLSLGYKSSLSWMIDLAARLYIHYPDSRNPLKEPAVVLIDEIDLHLHPSWQRILFDVLTSTFPEVQFIVTAHSPLVVQAVPDANVVLLKKVGNTVKIDKAPDSIKQWRVDQILTSELFSLPSSRPPILDKVFKERQSILSKAQLTEEDQERLDVLENEIGRTSVGETPEDIRAADLIRRAATYLQN